MVLFLVLSGALGSLLQWKGYLNAIGVNHQAHGPWVSCTAVTPLQTPGSCKYFIAVRSANIHRLAHSPPLFNGREWAIMWRSWEKGSSTNNEVCSQICVPFLHGHRAGCAKQEPCGNTPWCALGLKVIPADLCRRSQLENSSSIIRGIDRMRQLIDRDITAPGAAAANLPEATTDGRDSFTTLEAPMMESNDFFERQPVGFRRTLD